MDEKEGPREATGAPDEPVLSAARQDDAMRLLQAMGQVDDKFVLESSKPRKKGAAKATGRLAVFGTPVARRWLAGGFGLAACLLVAGLVVFGGQSGSVTQSFEQVATTQVSEKDVAGGAGQDDTADAAGESASADASGETVLSQESGEEGESGAGARAVADGADEPAVASSAEDGSDDASGSAPLLAIANPWQECSSLEEAAALAGFDLEVSCAPKGCDEALTYIQVIADDMIEVDYYDARDERVAYVRKGKGVEDVSGDYNAYACTETRKVGAVQVELRGSDEGWSCVTWTSDGYSYAIGFDEPVSTEEVEALVAGIA